MQASPIFKRNAICHTLEDFGDGEKDKELPTWKSVINPQSALMPALEVFTKEFFYFITKFLSGLYLI